MFHQPAHSPVIIKPDQLKLFFKNAWCTNITHKQPFSSQQRLLGEKSSSYNGRGMDYSESRSYVSGDDIRHINWKQSAKSSELISNLYYQENENIDYILLDLRRGMMFGTRFQSKAAIAIKAAIVAAMSSVKQHKSVCVVELGNNLKQSQLMNSYETLLAYFSTVALKTQSHDTTHQTTLFNALKYLRALNPAYSLISVISDCNELTEKDVSLIKMMSSDNQLTVYKVSDPLEKKLPEIYPLNYQLLSGSQSVNVTNKSELNQLQSKIDQLNNKINGLLNMADITVSYLSNQLTDDAIMKEPLSK